MYINKKQHYLSHALFWAAAIHAASYLALGIIRKMTKLKDPSAPYITNSAVTAGQLIVSALQVMLIAIVFVGAWEKVKKTLSVIDETDRLQMAVLQKEAMGAKTPALTGDAIEKLLELWGAILIAIRMVYDICSLVYRKFVMDLMTISDVSGEGSSSFTAIYNNTHGFKYVGMLIAILLGTFMTAIFLDDNLLKIISMILMVFFLLSFVLLGMQMITVGTYSVGIVWTSVIFHFVETVGLFVLGLYLRKKYIGL